MIKGIIDKLLSNKDFREHLIRLLHYLMEMIDPSNMNLTMTVISELMYIYSWIEIVDKDDFSD